jgi:serine 3-dehydrogenase
MSPIRAACVNASAAKAVVVVTGASRGVGRAVASRLADNGHSVVAWARNDEDLRALASSGNGRIEHACVDVRERASVATAVAAIRAKGASVRAVVLNAGVAVWSQVDELDPSDWHRMLDTNLTGAFHTLSLLTPLLRDRATPGQVVAVLSDSAWYQFPGRAGYCASKAGLESLVETFRRENRSTGVRVTALYPSRVDTHFRNLQPGSRPGALHPGDVASVVEYVLDLPAHVEIRSLAVSSVSSSFGPYTEIAASPLEQPVELG